MKLTISLISVLATCLVNVAAQDLSSLPSCAQSCATNAIPSTCGLNISCICSTSTFITSVACCVAGACDPADQETTIKFAEELCAGAGITTLPTSAACPATASASGSGTQSATGASASTSSTTSAKPTVASSSAVATPTVGSSTPSGASATSGSSSSTSPSAAATSTGAAAVVKLNGVVAAGAGAAAFLAAMFLA